jgi:hypothetical protein
MPEFTKSTRTTRTALGNTMLGTIRQNWPQYKWLLPKTLATQCYCRVTWVTWPPWGPWGHSCIAAASIFGGKSTWLPPVPRACSVRRYATIPPSFARNAQRYGIESPTSVYCRLLKNYLVRRMAINNYATLTSSTADVFTVLFLNWV